MTRIAPSILSADFVNLERDIRDIAVSGGDWVHVDVMDGVFVPNLTIGIPVVKAIRPITDLPLDVHLMIQRPVRYVAQFIAAGADYVSIHVEADTLENNLAALDRIASMGAKPAIALKPGTPAEAARPYLTRCALILVMTVEPGFSGQKFMADQMPKLKQMRALVDRYNPSCLLEVDGGVDAVTAGICKAHGADVLVAGSAYFGAPDRPGFVREIKR